MKRLAATARGGRSPTRFAFTLGFWFEGVQGTTLNAQLGTDPTPDDSFRPHSHRSMPYSRSVAYLADRGGAAASRVDPAFLEDIPRDLASLVRNQTRRDTA